MKVPDKLPIIRMEEYHTHYLGKTHDGKLFWGYETFIFTKPYSEIKNEDWKKYRKEFAILHLFDKEGNYLNTKHWSCFLSDDSAGSYYHLQEIVNALGDIEYSDIEIKLFQTTIDNVVFALVPNYEFESIDLQPSSTISFREPWDGE